MSTQVDKQELKDWIDQVEDETILEGIQFFRESTKETGDWWNGVSDAEKAGIDRGLADSKAGRTTPHEEVRKSYKKWL